VHRTNTVDLKIVFAGAPCIRLSARHAYRDGVRMMKPDRRIGRKGRPMTRDIWKAVLAAPSPPALSKRAELTNLLKDAVLGIGLVASRAVVMFFASLRQGKAGPIFVFLPQAEAIGAAGARRRSGGVFGVGRRFAS
jgi:hypothetical protein